MARGSWLKDASGAYETWPGGRIWVNAKSAKTYVIEKCINGKRYGISTRTASLKVALQHWERFQADPEHYRVNGLEKGEKRLLLDDDLITEYLRYSEEERHNSPEWLGKQRRHLEWWRDQLRGLDLRRLTLTKHLTPPLQGAPSRRHRVEVIKHLHTWLRSAGRMSLLQDATEGLHQGPIRPEQWRRPKAVPQADLDAVLKELRQPWNDLLTIQVGTGIHTTELLRFCRQGEVLPLPPGERKDGASAIMVIPQHKSGSVHRIAVSARVAEAAQRQRDRGGFANTFYYRAIHQVCDRLKVSRFGPGQMRHTVATRAVEAGADPAAVAAFLGHKSASTTLRFYATLASVPRPQGIAL